MFSFFLRANQISRLSYQTHFTFQKMLMSRQLLFEQQILHSFPEDFLFPHFPLKYQLSAQLIAKNSVKKMYGRNLAAC